LIRGFPPIEHRGARVLVLGSMPGVASLSAGEYYAHPRNQFWRIIGELYGFDPAAPYRFRAKALCLAGVALWDVLASCARPGSLDADIDERSIVVNPFAGFLDVHPHIRRVCFNGRKAEAAWRRYVLHEIPLEGGLSYEVLPSTSPAHAAMSYPRKLRAWRRALTV
jgi:hypoxanthine-DNA glycosylase